MPGFFDSIIPQEWIDPLQQKLDERRQDQSVGEAQIRGFGAGALQGLRDLVSPANIAGLVMSVGPLSSATRAAKPFAGPVMKGLQSAADPLQKAYQMEQLTKYLSRIR